MSKSLRNCFLLFSLLGIGSSCKQDAAPPTASEQPTNEVTQEPTPAPPKEAATLDAADEPEAAVKFVYHNPLTDAQKADGWLSLFDGHSLFGWASTNEEVNWRVVDGNITADAGPIGLLMTTLPFSDYELIVEYRSTPETNSGLFLRSEFPPGDITTDCYEVNIADAHPDGFTTGSLVNRKSLDAPVQRRDGWNELKMTLNGPEIEVAHNGEVILNESSGDSVAASGRIGLQKNAGLIEFRKVILKPLGMTAIFNGKDLTGWRNVPGSKSQFTVEDGEIHVKDGQGFIETEKTYQNFLFQAQAISHAAELNSGFFFRAMPGTEEAPSHGYEYQIHNGFKDGDRSQPNNAGTGAIFRRVDARYIVANDKEWFTATLIANGPDIGCWVDGYQVVDWSDDRKPDPNPRRGLRLEGGHISIQGHDPTTDLSFKDLRIVEYHPGAKSENDSAATQE